MAASLTDIKKAEKKVMAVMHKLAKTPNSDYDAVADAIEGWAKKRTASNFSKAVKLVVPYVEDVTEEMESDSKDLMFTDTDIVNIAEVVVETHAKHMNESVDIEEDQQFKLGLEIKESLKQSLMKKAKFLS
jgi:hypothetical protein